MFGDLLLSLFLYLCLPEASGITISQSKVPVVIGALVAVVVIVLLVVVGVAVAAWQFG